MEKFDLDDQPIEFDFPEDESEDVIATGTLEDDTYEADNEDLHEQFAFVKDMLGEDAVHDKRNTYNMSPDGNKYDEFLFETKGGKGIRVVHDTMGSLWRVEFTSGGSLPNSLTGKFTSDREAIHAVEQYLAKQS